MKAARSLTLTMSMVSVAMTLGACATVTDPLQLLDTSTVFKPAPKPAELSMQAEPVAVAMKTDYVQQIEDLQADNLELMKELADARNQTAKLKRQLKDAMQDNSLLRDLAARKMR